MVYTAHSLGYDIVNWSDFVTDIKNPYGLKEKYLKSGYIVRSQDNQTALILIHKNMIYFLDSNNCNYTNSIWTTLLIINKKGSSDPFTYQ